MHSVGQLLVDNLVPVRVSEAKAGTPTVKFGKGKLHRATFRLDMMPGAPDVEAQVRSHARFDQIRDALAASSDEGVSGGGGAPADGGNDTAMPEAELAGPTLRTDAQRPALSWFEPTENPRDRAHGSRRPNGLDEAERSKPQLAAKLRALLSNVQTAASGEVSGGSDLFDGEMERTAAVTLHSALLELLSAAQPDEELASIRVESTAATVNARFQGVSGKLTVEPPMPKFSADTSASEAANGARDSHEWQVLIVLPPCGLCGVRYDCALRAPRSPAPLLVAWQRERPSVY